jgi:hypothetical protein
MFMDTIGYILEIHKNPRVLNVAQVGQVDVFLGLPLTSHGRGS